jgi:hypothetical protein
MHQRPFACPNRRCSKIIHARTIGHSRLRGNDLFGQAESPFDTFGLLFGPLCGRDAMHRVSTVAGHGPTMHQRPFACPCRRPVGVEYFRPEFWVCTGQGMADGFFRVENIRPLRDPCAGGVVPLGTPPLLSGLAALTDAGTNRVYLIDGAACAAFLFSWSS